MPLAEQLANDLKDAMRAGETRRRDVIRYLRAAVKNASIEHRRELTDDEILGLVRYQIKQRRDSIDLFRKGNRADLADEEQAQVALLESYLPTQLDDAELLGIVQRIAAELDVSGPRDMSKLMPALLTATGGRVDGRRLSEAARAELARRSAEPTSG